METTNIALQNSECIKTIENIGNYIYQNICDGTVTAVPWGSWDWVGAFMALGLIGMLGTVLAVVVVTVVFS